MNYTWIGDISIDKTQTPRYRIDHDDESVISTSLRDLQLQANQLQREICEKSEVLSSLKQHIKNINKLEGERRKKQN